VSWTQDTSLHEVSSRTASPVGVFYGWWIVAASFACLMVGINPIANLTFGVFLAPLSEEFGWSRSQAAHGISLAMLGFTLTQPLIGKLIARHGAQRIILGSAALFSIGLFGISSLVTGRWSFYTCTFLWGAVAGGTSPLPHGTIIARWFAQRRGLAMGIVAAGAASGGIVLPPLVSYIINAYGWRSGFALLGILSPCIILPIASLVIRNTPEEIGLHPDGIVPMVRDPQVPPLAQSGYTAAEARSSATFWVLAVSLFMALSMLQSSAVHLVPLLLDRGFALTQAASVVSFLATGAVLGMVSSGYLVDRIAARVVAIGFFVNAAVSLVLLWLVHSWVATLVTAVLLGMGIGAMLQLIPALVGWCFGLRAFGEIYGMMMTAFGLGTVTGPLLGGWLHDVTGSYRQTPLYYLVGILCAAALMSFVRKYPGPGHNRSS
jgi:MFS family permease